jgi:hypothetical protein
MRFSTRFYPFIDDPCRYVDDSGFDIVAYLVVNGTVVSPRKYRGCRVMGLKKIGDKDALLLSRFTGKELLPIDDKAGAIVIHKNGITVILDNSVIYIPSAIAFTTIPYLDSHRLTRIVLEYCRRYNKPPIVEN